MPTFNESEYTGEPIESPVKNGAVLESDDSYDHLSQDARFDAVDRLVDLGVANYADAARRLDYVPEAEDDTDAEIDALFALSEKPRVVQGASVSLAERAIAVTQLLKSAAMQNKYDGAQKSGAVHDPGKMDGMQAKAANFKHSQRGAIETLSKTQALRAAGFSEVEVLAAQVSVERHFNTFKGVGSEANGRREKEKRTVARTERRGRGLPR